MLVSQDMSILIRSTNLNINTRYQFNIEYFPVYVNMKVILASFSFIKIK